MRDEGVGENKELSCDGDESSFWGFPIGDEAPVEDLHVGVVSTGRDGSEVEDFANDRSTAPDRARTAALTRIVGDRSKTCQRTSLFVGNSS